MTHNCDKPRAIIKKVWPKATLLLCNFHILQQVWRWLYEKEHGISKGDIVIRTKLVRTYASDFESYEIAYKDFADSSSPTQKYKNCLIYFEELFDIIQCWVRCFWIDQLLRGSNTNNFVEAQFLAVNDTILRRQRQCNNNQLLDKLIIEFENQFK